MPGPRKQHGLAPAVSTMAISVTTTLISDVTTATVMTRELASLKPTECHRLVE